MAGWEGHVAARGAFVLGDGSRSTGARHGARPRRWRGGLLAVILAVALAWGGMPAGAAQGSQGIQGGWPVDNSGNVVFSKSVLVTLPLMQEAGAGWVRINFRLGECFSNWTSTGCNGKTALATYDQVVDAARSRGLQVLGLLSNEAWRGGQEQWVANSAEVAKGSGDNDYLRAFSLNAAVPLAKHFRGRVAAWEVWNEPNAWTESYGRGRYGGGTFIYPSNFAWLLRHVYEDTRAAGIAGAQLISGGLFGHDLGGLATVELTPQGERRVVKRGTFESHGTAPDKANGAGSGKGREGPAAVSGESGAGYLRATYDAGRRLAGWEQIKKRYKTYPLDGIGQHLYIDQGSATTGAKIKAYLDNVRAAYAAYEGKRTAKATHVTEMGWETPNVSQEVQASNLRTSYGTARQVGYVARIFWNAIQDIPEAGLYFGLTYLDGAGSVAKKQSFQAYQEAAVY